MKRSKGAVHQLLSGLFSLRHQEVIHRLELVGGTLTLGYKHSVVHR